jgi:tRNA threonylcarbamoyladenosine biosynthesis protein TsaE
VHCSNKSFESFSSPTFTIINQYENGAQKAFHMDVYRIEDPSELPYAGYDDCMEEGCFTVIEWANLIENQLPPNAVKIALRQDDGSNRRFLTIAVQNEDLYLTLKEALHAYLIN